MSDDMKIHRNDSEAGTMPDLESENPESRDIGLFTPDQTDALEKAVIDAFRDHKSSRARDVSKENIQKAVNYLRLTAQGEKWSTISKKLKLEWMQVNIWKRISKPFLDLVCIAVEAGNELRQILREEAADRRGVEGFLDPVFWDGKKVGTIRRFSDKCLELQLRAHSAKYREKSSVESGKTGGGIVLNITGVVLGQQPPPKTYGFPVTNVPKTAQEDEALEESQ